MALNVTKCIRCVDGCVGLVKFGKTKSGNQRYICKLCKKTKVEKYVYHSYKPDIDRNIILFTKEGLGIRSTARILKISTTTLLKRIVSIAATINQPTISKGKTYEVDEMCPRYRANPFAWSLNSLL